MTDVGQMSLYLVTAAMAAYLVATIAFAIDLSRAAERLPAARKETRALAGVGGGGVPGPTTTADVTASDAVSDGPEDGDDVAAPLRRRAAGIGMATFTLATLFLLGGVITRGIAAGRVPWANMYEFTTIAITVAGIVFLGIQRRRDVRFLGTFVSLVAVLSLWLALQNLYIDPTPVQPALQSTWLVIHVSIAAGSMGVFAVATAFSLLQLVKDRAEKRGTVGRVLASVPSADDLERRAFRVNAVGFVLWTFVLISGAIWANDAWGRFWGWDAKEVGSFVVWVIYAAYLHARSTRGWEGRRAAWFSVAGFVALLLNYYVINLFANSLHSYSGV